MKDDDPAERRRLRETEKAGERGTFHDREKGEGFFTEGVRRFDKAVVAIDAVCVCLYWFRLNCAERVGRRRRDVRYFIVIVFAQVVVGG